MERVDRLVRSHPFWRLLPYQSALLIFILDFGVLFVLRSLEDHSWHLDMENKTFLYGDGVLLPAYAWGITLILQKNRPASTSLLENRYWHLGIILGALLASIGIEYLTVKAGYWGVFGNVELAKTYHRLVFCIIFYLLVSVLPAIYRLRQPKAAFSLVIASLTLYLIIAGMEMKDQRDQSIQEAGWIKERMVELLSS